MSFYKHKIGEVFYLSQGEKQLLTIARAMLAKTPMLILDEATSSVDTRTEILIQKAMDNLMQGKTSFVIAHRLSTIEHADKIIFLEKGRKLAEGTLQELLQICLPFRLMWENYTVMSSQKISS